MRRIILPLFALIISFAGQAQSLNNELSYSKPQLGKPYSDSGIDIYPTVVTDELNIDIDDKLANGSVTVSIFNSSGIIVLESILGLGLNKIDVDGLAFGKYVAVVRHNDEFRSKSEFEIQ